jgi:hypothetical protein
LEIAIPSRLVLISFHITSQRLADFAPSFRFFIPLSWKNPINAVHFLILSFSRILPAGRWTEIQEWNCRSELGI